MHKDKGAQQVLVPLSGSMISVAITTPATKKIFLKKKEKKNLLQLLPSLFDPYGLSLQLVFVFSSFGGQYLFFS